MTKHDAAVYQSRKVAGELEVVCRKCGITFGGYLMSEYAKAQEVATAHTETGTTRVGDPRWTR